MVKGGYEGHTTLIALKALLADFWSVVIAFKAIEKKHGHGGATFGCVTIPSTLTSLARRAVGDGSPLGIVLLLPLFRHRVPFRWETSTRSASGLSLCASSAAPINTLSM